MRIVLLKLELDGRISDACISKEEYAMLVMSDEDFACYIDYDGKRLYCRRYGGISEVFMLGNWIGSPGEETRRKVWDMLVGSCE